MLKHFGSSGVPRHHTEREAQTEGGKIPGSLEPPHLRSPHGPHCSGDSVGARAAPAARPRCSPCPFAAENRDSCVSHSLKFLNDFKMQTYAECFAIIQPLN